MKLHFQSKLVLLLISLLFLILLIQGYIYFVTKRLFLSSLLSFIIIIPIAYLLVRRLTQPILEITQKAIQLASGSLDRGDHSYSNDDLGRLSKAIDGMGIELRTKIDEVSKERDYLQTVLKGMVEGVLVVDGRARILMANDALRSLLSLSSDVTDRMPLEVIRNAELEAAIRSVVHDEPNKEIELNVTASGGKTLEVNVVGILASTGKEGEGVRGAIAVFHDITRLKELENIRQDFVANVSHELRTPLTTIKGYAETLLEGALKEKEAFQFVQIIKKHTDRLTKIVEDLLVLSKIESKEFQLKLERVSLSELINDVLEFVREAAEKRGMTVFQDDIPSSLIVEADRYYLEQVFHNLLDNAIKYGRQGGTITISATEKDHKAIQISVKDNGLGSPGEDLPRIFERFYRVDKGRSQELGGTGLGLSIVKHIVQAHGGRVWAESQIEQGSTIYFTLPAYKK